MIYSDFYGNDSAPESKGGPVKTKGAGPDYRMRIVLDAQSESYNLEWE